MNRRQRTKMELEMSRATWTVEPLQSNTRRGLSFADRACSDRAKIIAFALSDKAKIKMTNQITRTLRRLGLKWLGLLSVAGVHRFADVTAIWPRPNGTMARAVVHCRTP